MTRCDHGIDCRKLNDTQLGVFKGISFYKFTFIAGLRRKEVSWGVTKKGEPGGPYGWIESAMEHRF
jgi:hypothetical protein